MRCECSRCALTQWVNRFRECEAVSEWLDPVMGALSAAVGVSAPVGHGARVCVEVRPPADGDSFDGDGRNLVRGVPVNQAEAWAADAIGVEVQLVTVAQIARRHTSVELHARDFAVTNEHKQVQRHFLGSQVWERINILLKARQGSQVKRPGH